jgi:hypothetical protein
MVIWVCTEASTFRGLLFFVQSLSMAAHHATPSVSNSCTTREEQFLQGPCRDVATTNYLELLVQCGGGFEDLHSSPASNRRHRKGNPVPRGISEPASSCGI